MPITEGPFDNQRTAFVRTLFELMKDNPEAQRPYRERHEQQVAEVTAREALRERMTAMARLKRGRKPGSRPWQKAGFATRQAWLDATQLTRNPDSSEPLGEPREVEPLGEPREVALPQTHREMVEAKLKR